jgi:hypothetical protein
MLRACLFALLLLASTALSQTPSPPTTKQLMLDLIHPAANDILLSIYRGGPHNESDWALIRRNALALAESATLLRARNSAPDWAKDAQLLGDAGSTAYKAAQAKDAKSLAAVAEALDASCTTCHKQFRPAVFPREGGSK